MTSAAVAACPRYLYERVGMEDQAHPFSPDRNITFQGIQTNPAAGMDARTYMYACRPPTLNRQHSSRLRVNTSTVAFIQLLAGVH